MTSLITLDVCQSLVTGQESGGESWLVFLAAFGGGLAGAAALLIVEWVRRFWDRPRLEVKASLRTIIGDEQTQVFIEAINPSDKPVTVTGFGLQLESGEAPVLWLPPQPGYPFPFTIDGGKSYTQWFTLNNLLSHLRETGHTPADLKFAWFRTQTDRIYRKRLPKKLIRVLSKEFRRQAGAGNG